MGRSEIVVAEAATGEHEIDPRPGFVLCGHIRTRANQVREDFERKG